MAIVNDTYMQRLLKTVYLSGVTNSKYQASPVLSDMKKESWGGGKELAYAAQYGNGGNFASKYDDGVAGGFNASARNVEWKAEQGEDHGWFYIDQPELLTSDSEKGAYMNILANKMSACFDGVSKRLATYLYGGKYGTVYKLAHQTASTGDTVTSPMTIQMDASAALKLEEGARFVIATGGADNSALPSSALLGSNATPVIFTVTAVNDTNVTATPSVTGGTIYNGDYVQLYGSRDAAGNAFGFEGLFDIVPSIDDRSGANWTSYIAQTFRGVSRNLSTNRLAGQFVTKANHSGSTTPIADTLVELLKKTKRAGGLNNMIVVNDEDWDAIGAELGIQSNLWQAANQGGNKNRATAGISEFATAFGDAFIDRTVIDPYAIQGKAYSYEKDDLAFFDLGNVSKVITPTGNDQLGKYGIDIGTQGVDDAVTSKLNMDKLFSITNGVPGPHGEQARITANIFGNFVLRKTASAGVASI